jgi:flagellin-like hook-associated protein FlgL
MSGLFSSVQFLASNVGNESMRSTNAIKKIVASGDPVKRAALQGKGAGGVSFAANLLNGTASKRSSINAFQNAMTYMQAQAEGIRQAEKIYQQMLNLASLAVDPMIGDDERALLSEGFESLRNSALGLNDGNINGLTIFDTRAATTQYQIDFLEGTDQDPLTRSGTIGTNDYWDITKDVIYNSGKLTIDHRPMGAWDRVTVFQKDPSKPLFDTGEWTTSQTDFDRFVIRYGPDRDTTFEFIPQSTDYPYPLTTFPGYPGNAIVDSDYDNKADYLKHLLGSTTDDNGLTPSNAGYYNTSGWESRAGQEFPNLGLITTNSADSSTSELTIRIEATGTVFDVKANWEPLEMEDAVVGGTKDLQVGLNPLGLGALRESESGFPKIAIDTLENAQKAIDSITAEIAGFSQQLGNLSSNMTRVEISMDAAQKQVATHQQALSGIGGEDFAMELLEISKARIARSQSAALMTQAMNLNRDIVNMLI